MPQNEWLGVRALWNKQLWAVCCSLHCAPKGFCCPWKGRRRALASLCCEAEGEHRLWMVPCDGEARSVLTAVLGHECSLLHSSGWQQRPCSGAWWHTGSVCPAGLELWAVAGTDSILHPYTAPRVPTQHPASLCSILCSYTASCITTQHLMFLHSILHPCVASCACTQHPASPHSISTSPHNILHPYRASHILTQHPASLCGILCPCTVSHIPTQHPVSFV